ncbi:hypothetical protein ACWT_7305 [Actinoplanes sp. SE50]|uniref:hypothetical protein n=1 Tax=unclassified Actinoplanes TaxID=2626549 RepID=UPI00023EDF95|nr:MULTISPECIES: hypothetical protein [unclassified Actinoplanes]AEV88315.1 hypothetical protein ACPL_7435 [Actinoplanes sp. SE50/110]ATO86720.1 hypothetical protein ACWT_7305 [Actinoplanes sp. SE50]SLM04138.1 hypothetical protein ACSP50_7440 [Actinoplanes sp. SE50/110]
MTARDRQPPTRDYQLMVSALAEVTRRRDAELGQAEQAYQDSAARAAGELSRAENDALAADRWAGAAAAQVLDVDREAARLWDQLRRARGMRVRALGEVPEPAPIEALPRVALQRRPAGSADSPDIDGSVVVPGRQSPRALLARAADRIDDRFRPGSRRPLPRWSLPLLPLIGAIASTVAGLIAAGLVTFGHTAVFGGLLIRGLGWLTFLIAPSAGVPAAAVLAHRRLHARLDIGGIGLTLLGGMVAATLLSLSFATH